MMKTNVKRKLFIVGIIILFQLIVCSFILISNAETTTVVGTWDVSASDDTSNVTATLYSDGKMVISGTGKMQDYQSSSEQPYKDSKSSIKTVKINQGVTSIGNTAFYGCNSLTSITIPSSVMSIGDYAFRGCNSLTSITIPSSVTSIGRDAFAGCSSLTSIEIPSSVTSIGNGVFEDCSSLTSITIPSSVTSIGDDAFWGCSSLTNIEIPNSVTSIGDYAFLGCSSLTSIEIPSSVMSIGDDAFWGCSSLTNIEIPNSVTSIGDYAFCGCNSLTSIEIPSSVTSIGDGAFNGCSSLTSIRIPSSVTSIGDGAFCSCSSLTSITIPSSVMSIGYNAFWRCSSLTSISVDINNQNYSSENGILFNKAKTELIQYPAGKNDTAYTIPNSVTSIGDHTFYRCSSLTSIEIPSRVTSIGDYAFCGCNSLTSIEIPSSITSIGDHAFYECSSLTSIEIPSSVTSIGDYIFYRCSSLTSIEIPSSVMSIGDDAFWGCSSLTSISVDINNQNYSSENGILFNKAKTELIQYPAGKNDTAYTIPNSVTSIGDYTFYRCSSLTSIEIPSSVTSIGYGAFWRCSSLTSISVDINNQNYSSENGILFNKAKTELIQYPAGKKDTAYTIPSSVTSIEDYAFEYCSSLTSIAIPSSITSIGDDAFYGTKVTVYCKSNSYARTYAQENNVNYVVDDEPPIISSVTGNPNDWVIGNVTLTINAKDDKSGLASKAYSFDGGATWQANNTKTYTDNTSGIVIKVRDYLGNIATYNTINITKIKKLVNIQVTTPPTKTTYIKGQYFNTDGMVVTKVYDNGSKEVIEDYTIVNGIDLQIGQTSVTISYEENGVTKTTEQKISVVLGVSKIEIIKAPDKVVYAEGQNFDTTGMIVTATYNDGSTKQVEGYTISRGTALKKSQNKVLVIYEENGTTAQVELPITVIDGVVKIEITTPPSKVEYTEGENFDTTGMVVIATNNDETTQEVTDYTLVNGTNLQAGQTSVKIRYIKDEIINEVEQPISVKAKTLMRIKITTAPNKTEYIEGEDFDDTGMVVTASYDNGTTAPVTSYTLTGGTNLQVGAGVVIISYTEAGVTKETAFTFTVKAKSLIGIKVTTVPNKTEYIEGEDFDDTGMVVTVSYDNGTTAPVTNYTLTGETNLQVGAGVVIISYTETGVTKETAFTFTVKAKSLIGIKVTTVPNKTEYIEGENFDDTGMVVTATYDNGTTAPVTNYTLTGETNLQVDQTSVTISYTEGNVTKTTEQAITVTSKPEEKLEITIKNYKVTEENGTKYIESIKSGASLQETLNNIESNGTAKVYKGTTKITDVNTKVATGMTIKISLGSQEKTYIIVVTGDLNGDGNMGDIDLLRLARYNAGLDKNLDGAYLKAADVYADGSYADGKDLLKIARVLAGLENL